MLYTLITSSDANLLAMAPIGILSTSLLTPMLPLFASLSKVGPLPAN